MKKIVLKSYDNSTKEGMGTETNWSRFLVIIFVLKLSRMFDVVNCNPSGYQW